MRQHGKIINSITNEQDLFISEISLKLLNTASYENSYLREVY